LQDRKLTDEPARLAALRRYAVLDTPVELPFEKITKLVQTVLGVPISAVTLIDADRQWLKSIQGLDGRETARDVAFCDHTIRTRQPMVVPDASLDPRFALNPFVTGAPHIASYAGVPLETPDGYNIGALCAVDVVPRHFSAAQIELLQSFAALVVSELELRRIAEHDQLTGALTRRAFFAEIDKSLARFARDARPASLVLLDIDHFKAINDSHGHAAGDEVLRAIARCCAGMLHEAEPFGRVGGEEFAMLFPSLGGADALAVVERIRTALEMLRIAHDPPLGITASFGIAPIRADELESERWMARADVALYAAKRTGRNRCCVSESAPFGTSDAQSAG